MLCMYLGASNVIQSRMDETGYSFLEPLQTLRLGVDDGTETTGARPSDFAPRAPKSPEFIYCGTYASTRKLQHFTAMSTRQALPPPIFFDCQGKRLSRHEGKMGLVQLAIDVYLVDVIECPESTAVLKEIPEDVKVDKFSRTVAVIVRNCGVDMEFICVDSQLLSGHEGGQPGSTAWEWYSRHSAREISYLSY
jgi:hypothetical protein